LLKAVPELGAAAGLGQGPYHHLDVLGHTLAVVGAVREELEASILGARVAPERREGLLLAALLHDVAKPVTRGEVEGRVVFVAHDTLGARLAHGICRRLGAGALEADLVATLTALHLKIGFMGNPRTDYPPGRLALAAGPFGEELAVLTWADRLGAQGPKLKEEHIQRHLDLCEEFLGISRELLPGPQPAPDYATISERLGSLPEADAGYAASDRMRLAARGLTEERALRHVAGLLREPL
jgi:poly(A) polymerase